MYIQYMQIFEESHNFILFSYLCAFTKAEMYDNVDYSLFGEI